MPRKTFTAGEVLAAADVNSFLMDQTVMSFAGTAARGSAITTPVEGMVTYLEDFNELELYDGSAWNAASALTLIKTAAFSGAVAHSFGSDADPIFTPKYDNYKIVISNSKSASTQIDLVFRVRANTTDLTTGTYLNQIFLANGTTLTGGRSTTASPRIGVVSPTIPSTTIVEVQSPLLAENTLIMGESLNQISGTGTIISINYTGVDNTLAYNGFTIRATENISGTLSVYGYKK